MAPGDLVAEEDHTQEWTEIRLAPLFANKLLIRTVESASVAKGWR
jgi:hypothetical protein